MTHIDFHVRPLQAHREHELFICELVAQLWRNGQRVHLHCQDHATVGALDELLWTFQETSFVPHAVFGSAAAAAVAVTLGTGEEVPDSAQVLVNLHPEVPPFFSQFEQVIETTGADESSKTRARQRYKFYKDRGYSIAMINA
ncbi:MAG: DNA polymerase III subunit chi [Gammaproteobacteria bacterium]|nr:DNA polymerase III subunit chi [Gammaproteobacteria bacterium]